mgnify:CR=1 FL=1
MLLTTSFKLDWSDAEQDFVLVKTGERLSRWWGDWFLSSLARRLN